MPTSTVDCRHTVRLFATVMGLTGTMVCADVFAQLQFDRLNACGHVEALYRSMASQGSNPQKDCRSPQNAVESTLTNHARSGGVDMCIERREPMLANGFSCVSTHIAPSKEMLCFRPARLEDLENYRKQYAGVYARASTQYMASAKQCSTAGGSPAEAQWTQMPMALAQIARFEFGFIMPLGNDKPPKNLLLHGWASTEPAFANGWASATEFIYLLVGGIYPNDKKSDQVGMWTLEVDHMESADRGYNEGAQRAGSMSRMDFTSLEISKDGGAVISDDTKLRLVKVLQDSIADALRDRQFRVISDDKLRASTGKSGPDILRQMEGSMPFGTRRAGGIKFAPTIRVLLNVDRPACSGDRGAMFAYVFAVRPEDGVAADLGSVGLVFAGVGECANHMPGAAQRFVDYSKDMAISRVRTVLRRLQP